MGAVIPPINLPPFKMADCGFCCALAKANGGPLCCLCDSDHEAGHKNPKKQRGKKR